MLEVQKNKPDKTKIKNDKLLFSTDFAWNIYDRTNFRNFDWESIKRVKKEADNLCLSKNEAYNILGENAIKFFNL
ncbi:MAG: hypothetical protein ABIE36_02935 [Candidatus Diapherotrites archaeon]